MYTMHSWILKKQVLVENVYTRNFEAVANEPAARVEIAKFSRIPSSVYPVHTDSLFQLRIFDVVFLLLLRFRSVFTNAVHSCS